MPTTRTTVRADHLQVGDTTASGSRVRRIWIDLNLNRPDRLLITWERADGSRFDHSHESDHEIEIERQIEADEIVVDPLPADRPRFILGLTAANMYSGDCRVCAHHVDALAGHRVRLAGGRWAVQHVSLDACRDACATPPEPAPERPTGSPRRGDAYVISANSQHAGAIEVDGEWFRVVRVSVRRGRRGGWYLNAWDGDAWRFYSHGSLNTLAVLTPIDNVQAAAFGRAYSRCVFCGRPLDTPESITVGYGPDCAAQRGLPWGNITEADRQCQRFSERVGMVTPDELRAAVGMSLDVERSITAHTCRACGEECATETEAADPAAHDCAAVAV